MIGAPTVVTAYYPIPSKMPIEKYIDLIFHFWPKMKCSLIFFTDPKIAPQFEELFKQKEGRTIVIGIPFEELRAFHKLSSNIWIHTKQYDPEYKMHSPELYAIWYEKKEFILRAIELNPFNSEQFIWCDAGIGRFPDWISKLAGFPLASKIPSNKMLVLRLSPFEGKADKYGIYGNFKEEITVGGGILASDINGWKSWSKAYDAMLMKYYLTDRFIGKDQNIMASMILKNPESVIMIDPPANLNTIQRWFFLLLYLGGVNVG